MSRGRYSCTFSKFIEYFTILNQRNIYFLNQRNIGLISLSRLVICNLLIFSIHTFPFPCQLSAYRRHKCQFLCTPDLAEYSFFSLQTCFTWRDVNHREAATWNWLLAGFHETTITVTFFFWPGLFLSFEDNRFRKLIIIYPSPPSLRWNILNKVKPFASLIFSSC